MNRAIKLSKGRYIARMDSDDISHPERIKKEVDNLVDDLDLGMVGTGYKIIDSNEKIIGEKLFPTSDQTLRKNLIKFNPFFHGSVMITKNALKKVGLYNVNLKYAQDYELWFRISKEFKLGNIDEYLMARRYAFSNISVEAEKYQLKCANKARMMAINEGQYPLWCLIYLVRPFIVQKMPIPLRNVVRQRFFESGTLITAIKNSRDGK